MGRLDAPTGRALVGRADRKASLLQGTAALLVVTEEREPVKRSTGAWISTERHRESSTHPPAPCRSGRTEMRVVEAEPLFAQEFAPSSLGVESCENLIDQSLVRNEAPAFMALIWPRNERQCRQLILQRKEGF